MKNLIIILVVWFLWSNGRIEAEPIAAGLLQVQEGRLYLSLGTESRLLPGSAYCLLRGQDTLHTGVLTQAYRGVSITDSLPIDIDFTALAEYQVWASPVVPDTVRPIRIAWDDLDQVAQARATRATCHTFLGRTLCHPRVEVVNSDQPLEELYQGDLEGVIGMRSLPVSALEFNRESHPAAMVAALIPNLASEYNRDGLLTTSLFYRFGPSLYNYLVDGDSLIEANWSGPVGQGVRPFPYDPEAGSKLFRSVKRQHRKVVIKCPSQTLRPLARYFADILSRQKQSVTMTTDSSYYDILIDYVYLPPDEPLSGINALLLEMSKQTAQQQSQIEALQLARGYVQSAYEGSNDQGRQFYHRKIANALTHDLGAFVLFRPRLFAITQLTVEGSCFDASGAIDLSQVTLLGFPEDPWGGAP